MCNRYYMEMSPEIHPFASRAVKSALAPKMESGLRRHLKTEGEIQPGDIVPVVAPDKNGLPNVYPMVWGFSDPESDSLLFNVSLETVRKNSAWKKTWERHRCVIPTTYYFEYENITMIDGKQKARERSDCSFFMITKRPEQSSLKTESYITSQESFSMNRLQRPLIK